MSFANDTFTDTTGTLLSAHTADSGATWTKHASSGAATLNITTPTGVLTSSSNATNAYYYISATSATADYDVQADMSANAGATSVAICGRMDTAVVTRYEVQYESTQYVLRRYVGGTGTNIGTFVASAPTAVTVKLHMVGTVIQVFIAGVKQIDINDNVGGVSAAGRAGAAAHTSDTGTTRAIDNWSASDVSSGPTTDQLSAAWYCESNEYPALGLKPWVGQHEVFVSDAFYPFVPIVPSSTTPGVLYNEHLDHPAIWGWMFRSQQADEDQSTNFIILPRPAWDTDADNQKAQLPAYGNLASDGGIDWTEFIILPLQGWDNDADLQEPQPLYQGLPSDQGADWTNFIVLPPFDPVNSLVESEFFTASQIANAPYNGLPSDAGQDTTQFLIIPAFDPIGSLVESEFFTGSQLAQATYQGIPSDTGQDTTQFLIIPQQVQNLDSEHQLPSLPYQGLASDQGQDWTQLLIIPAFDPSNSLVAEAMFEAYQMYQLGFQGGFGTEAGADPGSWGNPATNVVVATAVMSYLNRFNPFNF